MPKRARTYWKGYLRLSLVSLPIEIYNAVESKAEISFRQIHRPSGRRVNYEKTVLGIGKIDNAEYRQRVRGRTQRVRHPRA